MASQPKDTYGKSLADCKAKFLNHVNFRGFPYVCEDAAAFERHDVPIKEDERGVFCIPEDDDEQV